MTNRTVPAAAEGMPKPDYPALEGVISDAMMFAKLADYVASEVLGDPVAESGCIRVMTWERDILLFVTLQAKLAAEKASSDFFACGSGAR